MQGRVRVLILIALLIVVGAIAVVFLLNTDDDTPSTTGGGAQNQQAATSTPSLPTETPMPTQELVDVVVAVQPISRGSVITPGTVALRPWPKDALPEETNFIFALDDTILGARARTDLYVEQPVTLNHIVPDLSNLANVGSDAAAIIPQGARAVAIPMDRLTSVAYAIRPGDRVDVIVSLLYVDIDPEFQALLPNNINLINGSASETGLELSVGTDVNGRIESVRIPLVSGVNPLQFTAADWPVLVRPSEAPRPRLVTQSTIQNALVLWVDNFPLDGILYRPVPPATPTPDATAQAAAQRAQQQGVGTPAPQPTSIPVPDIVTLAVGPQEAVVLTWMVEARIPITFALRSAGDFAERSTSQVTLGYIMANYGIDVPPKDGFSVQPAIRSIRQLLPPSQITADSN